MNYTRLLGLVFERRNRDEFYPGKFASGRSFYSGKFICSGVGYWPAQHANWRNS